jgi:2-oxoglutarate ferredoxin oxidoreductase subunit alpha
MVKTSLTIGIVGAGGDGVVVLGSFLQKITALKGYFSQMPRYYGAQIRGGGSAVKLSLDSEHLSMPKDNPDILVCFDWDKYLEFVQELALTKDTLVIYEHSPSDSIELPPQSFQADFSRISKEVTGAILNKNIVALGLIDKILALPGSQLNQAVEQDKALGFLKERVSAIEAGERLFSELMLPEMVMSPPKNESAKLIILGNAAIAQGAVRAGCKAFFGYPITPSAEIMQGMQNELAHGEGVFIQAEDEIASVGMALGASLVGTKSMTSTSGPGLDLMTETMDLASSAEIPMVIVDVQRCGPATGIPSKSEQSDLNHAIYGGHGDTPRVVIAPYDTEECYRLTIESFNIAAYFQAPVILLSDQWLGQTFVAIDDKFIHKDYSILERKKPANENTGDYKRYRLTEDFISEMADVGDEGLAYQSTGLAHTVKGTPAFDFETNLLMHEKREKKLLPLCNRNDLVKIIGPQESARGIITWGSSAQFVLEVVTDLGLQNEIKVCIPELLCPLPDEIERFLRTVKKLLVVEMNYNGQFYHYLRSKIDLPKATKLYNRTGGRPFSIRELSTPVLELIK